MKIDVQTITKYKESNKIGTDFSTCFVLKQEAPHS